MGRKNHPAPPFACSQWPSTKILSDMGKQQRDTHKEKDRGKEKKRKYNDEHKKQLPINSPPLWTICRQIYVYSHKWERGHYRVIQNRLQRHKYKDEQKNTCNFSMSVKLGPFIEMYGPQLNVPWNRKWHKFKVFRPSFQSLTWTLDFCTLLHYAKSSWSHSSK